jgi:cardiolipin synthase
MPFGSSKVPNQSDLGMLVPMHVIHGILITLLTLLVVATAGHALLYKRDPRAAWGWIAVCLIFPLLGPFLYFLFGINRVRTRARKLERRSPFRITADHEPPEDGYGKLISSFQVPHETADIARISDAVTRWRLVGGNGIEVLHNGEQAYPAMLEAIEASKRSLYLTTYIFETNETGSRFIEALGRAAQRGVDVRIMLDGVGELYSVPRASRLLKRRGVRTARFLPPTLFPPTLHINLRNHRKILVADGWICFVGGMNIGDRHLAEKETNPSRVIDMHFLLKGPVSSQIERAFLEDWGFITGEHTLPALAPVAHHGGAFCRTIVDGPNEDLDKLGTVLQGAISSARRRVLIMTPYFLPPRGLIAAMQTAALRGAIVTIILPSKSNLPFVDWATRNMLWELLQKGVRVYYHPPPFVHTKLFVVDEHYAQIGSGNLDPRSLRLNFELNVEIYDRGFAGALASHVEHCLKRSSQVSLTDLDGRGLAVRFRDALAWLFSPYL